MGRSVLRGLLWGLTGAFVVLLVLVTLRSRQAPPPVVATGPGPSALDSSPQGLPRLSALPRFLLTDQHGREQGLNDLIGAPWVADFIFTRCPGPCPMMSKRMGQLGERLPTGVRRVSFTVDPEHDTPEVLRAYAERWGASEGWLFLTGTRQALWELSELGFKMGVAEGTGRPEEQGPIIHSTRFVLVDADGVIRGYYDAFESPELDRLVADAQALMAQS